MPNTSATLPLACTPATLRIEFTPGKIDEAECVVNGRRFHAASTSGAVFALCRQLVEAGVEDQPYAAFVTGRRSATPCFTGRVYAAARVTCRGSRIVRHLGIESPGRTSDSPMRPEGTPATTLAGDAQDASASLPHALPAHLPAHLGPHPHV